ncbi:unnamed protein product [Rhizoctonia solani]|uniref:Uncharacterized protein n=1 Tax=Rhizoctonia solani TaxID=456999 RepID=A0A8H2WSB4_9AGAM|nr:unnamed protein product [Rhizoctonia solani]
MACEHPANVSQEELTTDVPTAVTAGVEEDVTKELRLKLGNLKIQCDTAGSYSPSEPSSPIPDTPACKGYIIDSDLANQLLGECYYFVALDQLEQGSPELLAFSLSPIHRMVSRVDENSSFHHYHLDRSSESIVRFMIGDVPYQWDTRNNTLSSDQLDTVSGPPRFVRYNIPLYTNLEEAKVYIDLFQWDNSQIPNNLAPVSPPLTDDNSASPASLASAPPTLPGTHRPFGTGYFGPSPSQKAIDRWVDFSVTTHQATRDGTNLRCPENGCKASSRRPHALKVYAFIYPLWDQAPCLQTLQYPSFDRSKPIETYEECPHMSKVSPRRTDNFHKGSQGNMFTGRSGAL